MKFRKKPVVIEAIQYNGQLDGYDEAVLFTGDDNLKVNDGIITIQTLEGAMRVMPNDWIIKGVKGEFYPVRDDIFRETYEQID